MNPDVLDIVEKWLREHGYDGLVCLEDGPEDACGCGLDDFVACGGVGLCGMTRHCQAAYRHSDGLFYLEKEAIDEQ